MHGTLRTKRRTMTISLHFGKCENHFIVIIIFRNIFRIFAHRSKFFTLLFLFTSCATRVTPRTRVCVGDFLWPNRRCVNQTIQL